MRATCLPYARQSGCISWALVVWAEGIGWAAPSAGALALAIDLSIAASTGAFVYCGTLLAIWWLSGKPEGPETMLLSIAYDTCRHIAATVYRGRI